VEQGSAQETYVNQHWRPSGINIVAYQGADSVVRDLESGRIDGAVLSGMMADYSFLQQPQGKDFAFVGGNFRIISCSAPGRRLAEKRTMRCVRKLTARSRRFSPTEPIKNCRVNILALTSIPGHNVVMHPAGTDRPAARFLF
jgi:hypothetical protein